MIESAVLTARDEYLDTAPARPLPHLTADVGALWAKLDHLLYLPVLGLTRPRDLYYYQGAGLTALYGFTYKYLTLEHFLGQLTRTHCSAALTDRLAHQYVQAWYAEQSAILLFADWHVKPHWTKAYSHAGHVTMWGRVMPGTKQLILNGPQGRLLGGWSYPIDTHFSHILVTLEEQLAKTLGREIACTITDSEGGGRPLGERYAAADQPYLSVLPRAHAYQLDDFVVESAWEGVKEDPAHEVAFARWANPRQAQEDPRRLVLMRPCDTVDPTRIYVGRFTEEIGLGDVPWLHRQRWANNERRIRDLIGGANLNANFGYTYTEVPNRTRQRAWDAAQAKVEVTEGQLSNHQQAVHQLRKQQQEQQNAYIIERSQQEHELYVAQYALRCRQRAGRPTIRAQQRVASMREELIQHTQRFLRQQHRLWQQLAEHQAKSLLLRQRLLHRQQVRDAIDTETLCRERDLEKDQLMLNFQILLTNLHDWSAAHYFAPAWRNLGLDKATQMIYRKAGWVTWYADRVEVELESYRYADQQRAMEETCRRFNEANLRWRDGRLLRISVAA